MQQPGGGGEGNRSLVRQGPPLGPGHLVEGAFPLHLLPHLGDQPGLAQPRLTHHRRDATLPLEHALEGLAQPRQFAGTADHRRVEPLDAPDRGGAGQRAGNPEGLDGLGPTLDVDRTERLELEQTRDETPGGLGDLHRTRGGGLLHPGRNVDGVAHRRVLDPQVGSDCADDHQAGVDAHPDVEVDTPASSDLFPIRRYRRQDLETGPHGPFRVVLVGDRRSEEGQDGVAHQSGQRSLVPVDGGDEVFERAVHDLGPLLGVEALRGGGRALDVAEQHRDGAPLAQHVAGGGGRLELAHQLRRDEPTQSGVVRRRRRFGGRSGLGRGGHGIPHPMPALHAEGRPFGQIRPARHTGSREFGPALHAECRPLGIDGGTRVALHGQPPPSRRAPTIAVASLPGPGRERGVRRARSGFGRRTGSLRARLAV